MMVKLKIRTVRILSVAIMVLAGICPVSLLVNIYLVRQISCLKENIELRDRLIDGAYERAGQIQRNIDSFGNSM